MSIIKSYRSLASAGILSLALLPQISHAVPISGNISFNGSVTAFENYAGNGTVAPDYSLAHSLVFGPSAVSTGAVNAFAGVPVNSAVVVLSPLVINQTGSPMSSSTPLLTVTMGDLKFFLTSLTAENTSASFDALILRGTGTISDGNPQDDNSGTWTAIFNESTSSWNATLQTDALLHAVDNGSCCVLLGLGLIGLRVFSAFGKDKNVR
jgi:hypothetical protein